MNDKVPTLAEQIEALRAKRARLADELAQIDAELSDAWVALPGPVEGAEPKRARKARATQ